MYTKNPFTIEDPQKIREFIRAHPFATIISPNLEITHAPLIHEKEDYLIGHLAKANSHHKLIEGRAKIIFHGPHHYISPKWYVVTNKVPTWNYCVLHCEAEISLNRDDDFLNSMLEKLTHFNEAKSRDPWIFRAEESLIKNQLRGIIGIEVKILKYEMKWKLGQHQPKKDHQSMIENLEAVGGGELADYLKNKY